MNIRRIALLAVLLWSVFPAARAQQIFQGQRVPPADFAVMSWGPASADPQQLQWMKDIGLNIAGFGRVADLPAFEKANLRVFLSDRRVNNQIHALAPTLKKLDSAGVYHYPDVPQDCRPLSESKLVQSIEMTQRYDVPPVQARFLIGEFMDESGRPYLMLVKKDLSNSFQYKISLRKPGKLIHVSQYSGREEPFGREMDWVAPGAGHLFRIE